jgi:hypothetical protein
MRHPGKPCRGPSRGGIDVSGERADPNEIGNEAEFVDDAIDDDEVDAEE